MQLQKYSQAYYKKQFEHNFALQIADESQEVREETTRQLDKTVVKDWNYQVEFNKRQKENEKFQKEVYAYNEKQVSLARF